MSFCKVDFSLLDILNKESEMIKKCVSIRETMTDWLELAYQVEIMVVELQLKVILELRDSPLMESVDKLYYDLYSLISNKYGVVQTHYENFNAKLDLLDLIGKHDSKLSAEVDEAFQSFTKAWDAVKGELNTDLQECRERFEKLLDQVQLQLNDAGGNEEVGV